MPLNVQIVAPDSTWWSGEALSIVVPAADGDMGVLPGHQPVLALLRTGTAYIRPVSGDVVELSGEGGFFSVDSDEVTIVVDSSARLDHSGNLAD